VGVFRLWRLQARSPPANVAPSRVRA
jgi:hypothetical protein